MNDDDRALLHLHSLFVPRPPVPVAERPPGRTWSEPLPPRRRRPPPGKGAAEPDDPEPEAMAAGSCRFCREPVDLRESGADPDGDWSHLACWSEAGHPDVGWLGRGPDAEALAWALWHAPSTVAALRAGLGRDAPGLAALLLGHGLRQRGGQWWWP